MLAGSEVSLHRESGRAEGGILRVFHEKPRYVSLRGSFLNFGVDLWSVVTNFLSHA